MTLYFATVLVHTILLNLITAQNLTLPSLLHAPKPCPAVATCLKNIDKGKQCRILPVPKRSFIEPVPNNTYRLTKLRKGVWAYEDFGFVTLYLKHERRLAVIDFPDSPGSNKPDGGTYTIDAAEEVLDGVVPTRVDMIYSHDHQDHIGASRKFFEYVRETYPKAKVTIWGTRETRKRIRDSTSGRAVEPGVFVGKGGRTLKLGGGLEVEMKIVGGHSGDDLLLRIPGKGGEKTVIMAVDIVFPRWTPFLNLGITEDVTRLIEVHREILKMDFDVYIGGHMKIGNKGDVKDNLDFLLDLIEAARTGLQTVTLEDVLEGGFGKIVDPTQEEYGNIWFGFIGVVRRLQGEVCFKIMLEKWGCRIAGWDITGTSHCLTAITYVAFQG